MTKQLGFNMVRKHVKVEPDRWYYLGDKLGLLVWQDMPSTVAARHTPARRSAQQFERELKAMIDGRRNHPVHRDVGAVQRRLGPVRHAAHRGVDQGVRPDAARGQRQRLDGRRRSATSRHARYPGPGRAEAGDRRAPRVLGEFGGLGLPLDGHTWQSQANWGYRGFTTQPTR